MRCCGRIDFLMLLAARGRRGLAAAVAYVGGLESSMNGVCPDIGNRPVGIPILPLEL